MKILGKVVLALCVVLVLVVLAIGSSAGVKAEAQMKTGAIKPHPRSIEINMLRKRVTILEGRVEALEAVAHDHEEDSQ